MDFSKFRETGELSDITVVVDDSEFKLHKFPLYAKSDYFRNLTRNKGQSKGENIRLDDFPGGAEMFAMVADFCYNMSIPITKTNVVQLRCSAFRLEMEGSGNLGNLTDKYLQDTITSAKISRSIHSIVTLLLECGKVGTIAEKTGIVSLCVDALVECWLKPPTKFSSFTSRVESTDDRNNCSLCSLPVEWFVKILVKAQEDGVRMSDLASLAVQYVSKVLEPEETVESNAEEEEKGEEKEDEDNDEKAQRPNASTKGINEDEVAKILDPVLLSLPEESYNLPYITPEWLTKVLKIATTHGCACRNLLVKVAGEMLSTLSAEDLCIISPSVVHDIVVEAAKDPNQAQQACKLVDTYTAEMARKGVLTAETFKLLTSAAPENGRTNYNKLYDVLEYILKTEEKSLNQDQMNELIELVDFCHLNEDTLQKAFECEYIPDKHVAKGALALCHRLRKEADAMRFPRSITDLSSPVGAVSLARNCPSKGLCGESLKPGAEGVEDSVKAATDVLLAARTKLSGPLYNNYRNYSHPSGASHVQSNISFNSCLDDDTSFEDDYDMKYERPYRFETTSRPRSYMYLDRGSYFPYTHRY